MRTTSLETRTIRMRRSRVNVGSCRNLWRWKREIRTDLAATPDGRWQQTIQVPRSRQGDRRAAVLVKAYEYGQEDDIVSDELAWQQKYLDGYQIQSVKWFNVGEDGSIVHLKYYDLQPDDPLADDWDAWVETFIASGWHLRKKQKILTRRMDENGVMGEWLYE